MGLKALRRDKLFIVLRSLVIAELLAYLIFMGLALSADWGEIYNDFILSSYIPFEVIEFSFLGLFQLGLIILVFAKSSIEESDINKLINSGEHEKLEFKTSLRWDANRNQVSRELEKT